MKILIVDDSKAMQNIIAKSIKNVGYRDDQLYFANDGEKGLGTIRQERPDLVLCDMHMPNMTGLEMVKALRREKDATKVIIVSIDSDKKTADSVLTAGGNAFLAKPFTSDQLFRTIDELVGRGPVKRAPEVCEITQLVPPAATIERLLSSLAGTPVTWQKAQLSDVDFSRVPFYCGVLQDADKRVPLAIFMDLTGASIIAALFQRQSDQDALAAIQGAQLTEASIAAIGIFLRIIAALCAPSKTQGLLTVRQELPVDDPTLNLTGQLNHHSQTVLVHAISYGACKEGKIMLVGPSL